MYAGKSIADIVREVFPVTTSRALKQDVDKLWGQWLLEPPVHDQFETAEEDLCDFIEEVGLCCRYTHEQIEELANKLVDRGWSMDNVHLKLVDYSLEEEDFNE